ncbi:UDP-N-acetylmuramoyl-L-alanyl-D-glutamate synthetase [Reinekea sp. MED297]|uniref:UDP-N-acetylmuramoylalanine--D-glutamate ligase n=2 Tax=Reinekea TaxID=230494 RepID=A4BFR5_9GAMM|nr:UDP-N-acetylmuramoyl-L-alanyl-D-glutamate synthetase [Reinekea sp. MED297] [Reinekea blandensis MED297]
MDYYRHSGFDWFGYVEDSLMTMIAADKTYLVVGLGLTGVSCVRHLRNQGKYVEAMDSRAAPPTLADVQSEFPDLRIHLGFDDTVLASADVLVMSPGVPLADPAIKKALDQGVQLSSDIELFLSEFNGKVIAITGSNAKSTVTAWLGEALKAGGQKTLVAGNIGIPVLETDHAAYDVAVLELSSFQLELLSRVNADIACVLNISEDHMDRYETLAHYVQAKQKIYFGAASVLYNRSDALTQPLVPDHVLKRTFASDAPDLNHYGLRKQDGNEWLAQGFDLVLPVSEVALPGGHNVMNALAVLALADMAGNDRSATLTALTSFSGLPYRCQAIRERAGITFINDSKATNVGSTTAALEGLVSVRGANIHLLAGGQAKDQDLSPLAEVIEQTCKQVYAFGQDRQQFLALTDRAVECETLSEAFAKANANAQEGDIVLLSPACASFDQFENFEHRGQQFNQLVGALT